MKRTRKRYLVSRCALLDGWISVPRPSGRMIMGGRLWYFQFLFFFFLVALYHELLLG